MAIGQENTLLALALLLHPREQRGERGFDFLVRDDTRDDIANQGLAGRGFASENFLRVAMAHTLRLGFLRRFLRRACDLFGE